MKKFYSIVTVFFVMFFCCFFTTKNVYALSNNITAEIVIDRNTNRILHAKNINEKMFMASTTKILTAITVIENCDIKSLVTITKRTIGIEGSSIYLKEGEILSIEDLLYGLMLRSGNDCAETLAYYISGYNEKFADLMNSTSKKIGAYNSNFTNPHGLHNESHYTTAYDLALITSYAMKNETFRKIVQTKSIKITDKASGNIRVLYNKNKILNTLNGATGVKTGYTLNAGRCLVSSCIRNNNELICVVLNCRPMFERSKELIEKTFNEYSFIKLVDSDNIIGFTQYKNEKLPLIIDKDIILPLKNDEIDKISIKYDYPEIINNLNEKEKEIGKIKIFCENNLIFEQKIYIL